MAADKGAAADTVSVTILSISGHATHGPTLHPCGMTLKELLGLLEVAEGLEPVLFLGASKLEDEDASLGSLLCPGEVELQLSLVLEEEKIPRALVVSGAGLEECNGIYRRTDEEKRGHAVWRNEVTGSWIQWWGATCGWEMYHKDSGMCAYWTQQDDNDQSLPHERPFKVRGAPAPAPTVSRQLILAS
eukprot:TRINITY_DN81506_c0_g1_i1.p1 TRINITY_DN81506_c0_g1~~TRINITY_DN81506_c0_g1_i1.p1  ORF type:complete len:188 (+),score=34.97 TRINITY_DN81506_c0_g1_i1:88-651(+)